MPADVARRRLLFLSSDYPSFASHKAPLARAAVADGFDVVVAAGAAVGAPGVEGTRTVAMSWTRGGSTLRALAKIAPELIEVRRLLQGFHPDVVHAIDLKPAIVAVLASLGLRLRLIVSINGLGFAFVDASPVSRAIQFLCGLVLRAGARRRALILVQNPDDAAVLRDRLGVPDGAIRVIRGSGVDPAAFLPAPETPSPPVKFLIMSRLLSIKGIQVAVAALDHVRAAGVEAELVIAGAPDAGNPSAVSDAELAAWRVKPGVRLLGHVADIRPLLAECHVVVQPSLGGEGLPRALLEAAAAGRPMIATDVPGNREIVRGGVTGLLVPPGDPAALAVAMKRAASEPVSRGDWGRNARRLLEDEFSLMQIVSEHRALYRGSVGLDS
jgi:glycosyltransferase involved in cell wall biosynthesis